MQVMWSRWREAAVLLFHRGLGTQGEMEAALEEEAGFKTWMANNSSHHDSPAVDSPVARSGGDRDGLVVEGVQLSNAAQGADQEAAVANVAHASEHAAGLPSGPASSTPGGEPQMIGGVHTAELDQAIQAALGTSHTRNSQKCSVRLFAVFVTA